MVCLLICHLTIIVGMRIMFYEKTLETIFLKNVGSSKVVGALIEKVIGKHFSKHTVEPRHSKF